MKTYPHGVWWTGEGRGEYSTSMRCVTWAVLTALLAACSLFPPGSGSSSSTSTGGGQPADAGNAPDAAVLDGSMAQDAGPPDAASPDAGPPDAGPMLAPGDACTGDSDCASGACRAAFGADAQSVCVLPCTQQSDCAAAAGFFCAPSQAGVADGYCVPPSPVHCTDCLTHADCGGLADVCLLAPQDSAPACHVDCTLAGQAACPLEYTCEAALVDGVSRMLCMPNSTPLCKDALGGFCDRVADPQPCSRTRTEGTCTGTRACQNGRYRPCGASQPTCKLACTDANPPDCMVDFCAGASITPLHCGSCTRQCPGLQTLASNVSCLNASTCTFSCQGEHYDVDGNEQTGCEALDDPTGRHTQFSAQELGNYPCNDGASNPDVGSASIPARMVSDARAHEQPNVVGLDMQTGGAPDWYRIVATGGATCFNDLELTLQVYGSASPTCYQITVTTDVDVYSAQTDGFGAATVSSGSGSYNSGSDIYLKVDKICMSTTLKEDVGYTVVGHL